MQAATFSAYGGEVEIVDIPTPQLPPDSVLIAVQAASINPIDSIIRQGFMKDSLDPSLPATLGFDVAGVVVQCGEDVTRFQPTDAVYGRATNTQAGTLAEFAAVKESDLARMPY